MAYKIGVEITAAWKPDVFPSIFSIFKTLTGLAADNTLAVAIAASLKRIIVGYFISIVIGVIIGLTIVRFKFLDENARGLILGLQTLPNVCWVPFATLWYGLGESAIIFVIAIGSTFAISIAIESGIKNVDPLFIKAASTMGANGYTMYRNVIIPASLPSVIGGLKQGWSFAWRALISGEMLTATTGLGKVLVQGRELGDISRIIAVMIVIVALGLAVDKLVFERLENSIRYKWGLNKL